METVISLNVFPTQAGQTEGDSSDPSSAEPPGRSKSHTGNPALRGWTAAQTAAHVPRVFTA